MSKTIRNYNDKQEYHGYQEWYNWDDKLSSRGLIKNNNRIGYTELHKRIKQTHYFIK